MRWISSPFAWMCLLNVSTGLFSTVAGLVNGLALSKSIPRADLWTTKNPWLYVLGGSITILVGIGNAFQLSLGTLGTMAFICTSVYDGWFGPGSKDWRFYTLTAYIVVQSCLVLWSLQYKSFLSLP